MTQEVKNLKLKNLVLWTENPRDSIDPSANDQDIIDRALEDGSSKWNLMKLAKDMGDHYDFSELPTIVFHGKKPVVYDGNRRVIIGKLKQKLASAPNIDTNSLPDVPLEIPCNVCSKDIALQNVYRKHADTGSWLPLERDIFMHKHMGQPKSPFLVIEENTGLISRHPHLNKRFVKEEIFRDDQLARLGMAVQGNKLRTKHSPEETRAILEDVSRKVAAKEISTRHERGKILEVLDPSHQKMIDEHKGRPAHDVDPKAFDRPGNAETDASTSRQSKRVRTKANEIFGGTLYLRAGPVSNLYRDIVDLHRFYAENKKNLSEAFPCLTRMALRLISEAAAGDMKQTMDQYFKSRFQKVKSALSKDVKTTLSNCNVTETSIIQLLHTGAHNYASAANLDQTIAMSIVIGAILTESHGKAAK